MIPCMTKMVAVWAHNGRVKNVRTVHAWSDDGQPMVVGVDNPSEDFPDVVEMLVPAFVYGSAYTLTTLKSYKFSGLDDDPSVID